MRKSTNDKQLAIESIIDTKQIKCVLTVDYDVHPLAGAVGNRWNNNVACFIFTGEFYHAEQLANDKVREIAHHQRTKKINSYNIFLNQDNNAIPIING